ncbi:MAG: hypothetical protein ABSG25_04015, partial [Bryobacteraceae bacterium]
MDLKEGTITKNQCYHKCMIRSGFAPLIRIGIVAVIAIASVVGYFVWKQSATPKTQVQQASSSPKISLATNAPSSPVILTTANTTPSSTGASPAKDGYNLLVATTTGQEDCGGLPDIRYHDGGFITSGAYNGYHRIIAIMSACGPDEGNPTFVFATKDYRTFIVKASSSEYNYNSQDAEVLYNKAKVVGFTNLPIDGPPKTISLGNFVLIQDSFHDGDIPTDAPLKSLVSGLTFYAAPPQASTGIPEQAEDATYLGNDNYVLVKTPSGPLFDYFLVSQEEFKSLSETPASANGVFYTQDQISSTAPLYRTYGPIVPEGCGDLTTTHVLRNISRNDLTKIGTTLRGVALYALKDPNHRLNHDEFNAKITPRIEPDATTITTADDNKIPIPSYSDYAAKNPVLVFQDPWGRWTGLGEFDYPTEGGCGKPVIYLYPPKPTEVTVKFTTPMRLTTDIPAYATDGWDVLANPDGEITDLQPQFTDCTAIDPV